jgi:hypothetical protein
MSVLFISRLPFLRWTLSWSVIKWHCTNINRSNRCNSNNSKWSCISSNNSNLSSKLWLISKALTIHNSSRPSFYSSSSSSKIWTDLRIRTLKWILLNSSISNSYTLSINSNNSNRWYRVLKLLFNKANSRCPSLRLFLSKSNKINTGKHLTVAFILRNRISLP